MTGAGRPSRPDGSARRAPWLSATRRSAPSRRGWSEAPSKGAPWRPGAGESPRSAGSDERDAGDPRVMRVVGRLVDDLAVLVDRHRPPDILAVDGELDPLARAGPQARRV